MAKKSDFEGMDFGGDEFFPMDDFDGTGPDGEEQKGIVSYLKNLFVKTGGAAMKGVANTLMPSVVDMVGEIPSVKDEVIEAFGKEIKQVAGDVAKLKGKQKMDVKSIGKGIFDEFKNAFKTGDFTFGTQDFDMGSLMGLDDSGDDDVKTMTPEISATAKSAEAVAKTVDKTTKAQMIQDYKMYNASEKGANIRHGHNLAFLSSINDNVAKVAQFYATIGTQSAQAQIEYSAKALAFQKDTYDLLAGVYANTKRATDEEEDQSVNSIFGMGFDGGGWGKRVSKQIINKFKDSAAGGLMTMLGMTSDMGDMGMSPATMLKSQVLGMIPKLLLGDKRMKQFEGLNDQFSRLPGILNRKLVSMADKSNNPILRAVGDLIGLKDDPLKAYTSNEIKGLTDTAKFDKKFYMSVTDVIPALLSKIYSATSGQEEIYFDYKSGGFKGASHLQKEMKEEREALFKSNWDMNDYVSKRNTLLKERTMREIEDRNPDTGEVQYDENNKVKMKSNDNYIEGANFQTLQHDFDIIESRIRENGGVFDPKSDWNNQFYLDGLTNPKASMAAFIRHWTNLGSDERNIFLAAADELTDKDIKFRKNNFQDRIASSSGVAGILTQGSNEIFHADMIRKKTSLESQYKEALDQIEMAGDNTGQKTIAMKTAKRLEDEIKGINRQIGGNLVGAMGKSVGGPLPKTNADLMRSIYELLLEGVIVYPHKITPEISGRFGRYQEARAEDAKKKLDDEMDSEEFTRNKQMLADKEREARQQDPESGKDLYDAISGIKFGGIGDWFDKNVRGGAEKISAAPRSIADVVLNLLQGTKELATEGQVTDTDALALFGKIGGSLAPVTNSGPVQTLKKWLGLAGEKIEGIDNDYARGLLNMPNDLRDEFFKLGDTTQPKDFNLKEMEDSGWEASKDATDGTTESTIIPGQPNLRSVNMPIGKGPKAPVVNMESLGQAIGTSLGQNLNLNSLSDAFKENLKSLHDLNKGFFEKTEPVITKMLDVKEKDYDAKNTFFMSSLTKFDDLLEKFDQGVKIEKDQERADKFDALTDVVKGVHEGITTKKESGFDSSSKDYLRKIDESLVDISYMMMTQFDQHMAGMNTQIAILNTMLTSGKFGGGKGGGKILGPMFKGLGNTLKGYGKAVGGLARGTGRAVQGLFKGLGTAVGATITAGSKIIRGAANWAFGNTQPGLTKEEQKEFDGMIAWLEEGGELSEEQQMRFHHLQAKSRKGGSRAGKLVKGLAGAGKWAVGGVFKGVKGAGKWAFGGSRDTLTKEEKQEFDGMIDWIQENGELPDEESKARFEELRAKMNKKSGSRVGGAIKGVAGAGKWAVGGMWNHTKNAANFAFGNTQDALSKDERKRFDELMEKGKSGPLSQEEQAELDAFQERIKKGGGSRAGKVVSGIKDLGEWAIDKVKGIFGGGKDKGGGAREPRKTNMSVPEALNAIFGEVECMRLYGVGQENPKTLLGKAWAMGKNAISGVANMFGKKKGAAGATPATTEDGEAIFDIGGYKPPAAPEDKDGDGETSEAEKKIYQRDKEAEEKKEWLWRDKVLGGIETIATTLGAESEEQKKERKAQEKRHKDQMKQLKAIEKKSGKGGSSIADKAAKYGKYGALAGGVVAAGAMAYGIGSKILSATKGKADLAKRTGMDKASFGDKMGFALGADSNSKYGYDGSELSAKEQAAQGSNLLQAIKPKQFKTAVDLGMKGGNAIGKIIGFIPNTINKVFGMIFKNKTVVAKVGEDAAKKTMEKAGTVGQRFAKLLKECFPKLGPKVVAKFSGKLMTRLVNIVSGVGAVIEIAMLIKALIDGLVATKRIFGLAEGVSQSVGMMVCAGLGSMLSELIFGLIPTKTIASFIYDIFVGNEEKECVKKYKEFLDEKAKILKIPDSGRLQEYETNASMLGALFKSDKKSANLLGFGGNDPVGEYKRWRDELYKPVQDMGKSLMESFGGKSVVERLVPKNADDQRMQAAYREEFLKRARAMAAQFFNTPNPDGDSKNLSEDETGEDGDKEKEEEKPKNAAAIAGAGAAALAGAGVAGAALSGDGSVAGMPDVTAVGDMASSGAGSAASAIASGSGLSSVASLGVGAAAAASTTAVAAAKMGGGTSTSPQMQTADIKTADNNNPVAILNDSIMEMQTELETLSNIYAEQLRHNRLTERTMTNLSKQIQLMVEMTDRTANGGVGGTIRNAMPWNWRKRKEEKEQIKATRTETASIQKSQEDAAPVKTPTQPLNDSKEGTQNNINVNDVAKINGNVTDVASADANANAGSGGIAIINGGNKPPEGATNTQANNAKVVQGQMG